MWQQIRIRRSPVASPVKRHIEPKPPTFTAASNESAQSGRFHQFMQHVSIFKLEIRIFSVYLQKMECVFFLQWIKLNETAPVRDFVITDTISDLCFFSVLTCCETNKADENWTFSEWLAFCWIAYHGAWWRSHNVNVKVAQLDLETWNNRGKEKWVKKHAYTHTHTMYVFAAIIRSMREHVIRNGT